MLAKIAESIKVLGRLVVTTGACRCHLPVLRHWTGRSPRQCDPLRQSPCPHTRPCRPMTWGLAALHHAQGHDQSKGHVRAQLPPRLPCAEVEQAGNGSCSAYLSGCCPGHHPAHAGQRCCLTFCQHLSRLCWQRACPGAVLSQLQQECEFISLLSIVQGMRASANDRC